MKAEIICVGTELLLGDILNTNAQFLAKELAALGITVHHQWVVGDNEGRLAQLVGEAMERSDLLVFSGGLGPTADDLTKETVARCFDDTLQLEPSILEAIQAYFAATGRHMPPHNEKQAMVPQKGGWFENHNGTAPVVWFQKDAKRAVLLPGPPSELKPLWTEQVRPFLSDGQQRVLHSLTLRITGIGESHVEEKVGHLFENENPTAAIYAKTGEVQIRITARAASHEEGERACRAYAEKFRAILGDVIYGEDANDLEHTLVQTLTEKGLTVATAESCTGGLVSQRITQVPGSSEVFGFGFCTYANEAKHKLLGVSEATLATVGAVSRQTAAQMALGAARVSGADIAVSLTGIAGPGGGTDEKPVGLVYVGAARGDEVYVAKLLLGNRDRQSIRISAANRALDYARRLALRLPMPGADKLSAEELAQQKQAMR
ncbi:competence/damage-inducible protein A [Fournierella sp.]|uniref:competence/damage-inducible protein A n=1 Tax=Allofournierella sp. TaxID=1940256 RepID=UPI00307AC856